MDINILVRYYYQCFDPFTDRSNTRLLLGPGSNAIMVPSPPRKILVK